MSCLSATDETM